jgi:peroxiredoxin
MCKLGFSRTRLLCVTVVLGLSVGAGSRSDTTTSKRIGNFTLKDSGGQNWSLEEHKDTKAVAVLFIGTQCPINNAYMPRLAELHNQFKDKGVRFVGINPNRQDSAAAIAEHAKKHKIPFAVLRDPRNVVADQFGAKRTPEVFVLDAERKIRYHGRIDDQFGIGYQRPQATRHDLALAIEELLAGKGISVPTTAVAGCLIGRANKTSATGTITYAQHVSRIVQNRCQECHRPGQIGPMPLLTYDGVSAWSAMIREVVEEKRMPPWHADPRYGKFHNDRSLSKEDHDTLLAWIDQGCPKGDDKDLPAAKKFHEGWLMGKPDVVFTMPQEYKVPAKAPKNGVPYQHFFINTNFEEDMWIQSAEAKPGNYAVVHHILAFIVPKGKGFANLLDEGFLVAYAPGDLGVSYPQGVAKKIPKGAQIVLQMHYTPNGVAQSDKSHVGLIFAKKPPQHESKTRAVVNFVFQIPAGAANYKVASSYRFAKDAVLWSFLPHMHLRGKSFEYTATYPDGKTETILSVPRYDFGWQSTYHLKAPLRLPAGTRIDCTAHFDNSASNLNNPDPTQMVRWGQQTWEEMMIGFLDYSYIETPKKAETK